MSVKFEETATNEGVLHFTVSKEDAQKALKQAYNRVKGKVNIP
ncbi:trigger factor, partial [Aerococcus urinae]